jgi:hypothetical protein
VPGYEAPINLVYSQRNRSACCRIPMYSPNPRAKRVEFRSPDPSCNPYLAFAAMLMAGLDGINNRIDPGRPIDKNLYDLPPAEAKEVKSTPGSLDQALDALERDHAFLLRGDVFTGDVIETWLDYKRKREVDAIRLRPHPHEFHLYYDIEQRLRWRGLHWTWSGSTPARRLIFRTYDGLSNLKPVALHNSPAHARVCVPRTLSDDVLTVRINLGTSLIRCSITSSGVLPRHSAAKSPISTNPGSSGDDMVSICISST